MVLFDIDIDGTRYKGGLKAKQAGETLFVDASMLVMKPIESVTTTIKIVK